LEDFNMSSRYRPINRSEFAKMMGEMGFEEVKVSGCSEHVYERMIPRNDGSPPRFSVRIFSSVDVATGMTRDCGEDAIRILLQDHDIKRPVQSWRAFRTENALTNMRERAREAWKFAVNQANRCDCGSFMVERKSKSRGPFLGCAAFPVCRKTRPLSCDPVKKAA